MDKLINIKLPIQEIINQTINKNPKTECEFNNMLVYNVIKMVLDGLEFNRNKFGGKKIKKKTYKNKIIKIKKRKMTKRKRQIGGTNATFIILIISILLVIVKGITNTTDNDVIQRIKEAGEVSDIFRNYYGTCTLNTMLFLKTIDLPTFEDLSISMMKGKSGFSNTDMIPYLNKELDITGNWASILSNPRDKTPIEQINGYIERLKNKMILMRSKYGFRENQSILTVMNYPKLKKDIGHSVILWLTNNNEIIIIDPQKFIENGIILYTSELTTKKYLNNDKSIKLDSMRIYIRENIDIINRDTDLLVALHIEINDIYQKNKFSLTNTNLINTIARIKETEENIGNKSDHSEML